MRSNKDEEEGREDATSQADDAYTSDDSLVEKPSDKIDRAFDRVPPARLIAVYKDLARHHRRHATDILKEACLRDGILADWIIQRLQKPAVPARISSSPGLQPKGRADGEDEAQEETEAPTAK